MAFEIRGRRPGYTVEVIPIRHWMFRKRNEEVRRTDGQADPKRTAETENNKRDAENCTDAK